MQSSQVLTQAMRLCRFAFALRERETSAREFEEKCLDCVCPCFAVAGCCMNLTPLSAQLQHSLQPHGLSDADCFGDCVALGVSREVTLRMTLPRRGDWGLDTTEGPMRKRCRIRRSDVKLVFASHMSAAVEQVDEDPVASTTCDSGNAVDMTAATHQVAETTETPTTSRAASPALDPYLDDDARSDASLESDAESSFGDDDFFPLPEYNHARADVLQHLAADDVGDDPSDSSFPAPITGAVGGTRRTQEESEVGNAPWKPSVTRLVVDHPEWSSNAPQSPQDATDAGHASPGKPQQPDETSEVARKLRPFLMPADEIATK
jgi:hypothetical protein